MLFGLAITGPNPYEEGPRGELTTPFMHNIPQKDINTLLTAIRRKMGNRPEYTVHTFSHALLHEGDEESAADCNACVAAINEKLTMLEEEANAKAAAAKGSTEGAA